MPEPTFSDPDAYVARWSRRAAVFPVILLALGVLLVVCAAFARSVVLGLFAVVPGWLGFWLTRGTLRHIRSGTVVLGVDERGVYLGVSELWVPVHAHPWDEVDAVVHYTEVTRKYDDGGERWVRREFVGVLRHGLIVDRRLVQNWRLDESSLAAAVARFGRGTPYQDLPDIYPPGRG